MTRALETLGLNDVPVWLVLYFGLCHLFAALNPPEDPRFVMVQYGLLISLGILSACLGLPGGRGRIDQLKILVVWGALAVTVGNLMTRPFAVSI